MDDDDCKYQLIQLSDMTQQIVNLEQLETISTGQVIQETYLPRDSPNPKVKPKFNEKLSEIITVNIKRVDEYIETDHEVHQDQDLKVQKDIEQIINSLQKTRQNIDKPCSSPYMEITVRMNTEDNSVFTYTVDLNGLVGSKKASNKKELVVGRNIQYQHIFEHQQEMMGADIQIPRNTLSSNHFLIDYKSGFINSKPTLSDEFKLASRCLAKRFPPFINKLIWSFTEPERAFKVQDLGSLTGTYVKLDSNQYHKIEKHQIFLIGDNVRLIVKDLGLGLHAKIQSELRKQKILPINHEEIESKISSIQSAQLDSRKSFIQMIKNLIQQTDGNLKVIDQGQELREEAQNSPQIYDSLEYQGDSFQPYIHIEVATTENQVLGEYLLIERPNPVGQVFKFGRSVTNDVVISNSSVSRQHCVIKFDNGFWYLKDGDGYTNFSTFGTCLSLTKYDKSKLGYASDPYQFTESCELRIEAISITLKAFNNCKTPL